MSKPNRLQVEKKAAADAKKRRRLSDVIVNELSLVDNPAVPKASWVIAKRDGAIAMPTAPAAAVTTEEVREEVAATEIAVTEVAAPEVAAPEVAKTETTKVVAEPATDEAKLAKATIDVGRAFATAISTLRAVAGVMDPGALHRLADMIDYATWKFQTVPEILAELSKATGATENELVGLAKKYAEKLAAQPDGEEVEKSMRVIAAKSFSQIEQAQALLGEVVKTAKKITKSGEADGALTEGSAVASSVENSTPDAVAEPVAQAAVQPVAEAVEVPLLDEVGELLRKQNADKVKAAESVGSAQLLESLNRFAATMEKGQERMEQIANRLEKATGKAS